MLSTAARNLSRRTSFARCSLERRLDIPPPHPSPSLVASHQKVVGRMFSVQQSLPKLPVPALGQTLDKYLKAVEPILSDEDYTRAEQLVGDFGRPGGVGRKLQLILEDRARHTVNWLEDWWLNTAYLDYRLPCAIHVNPGVMFPEQTFETADDWLDYAAQMVSGILDYKGQIDDLSLAVEQQGGKPLCMKQFYAILSSCRIPGKKHDSIITYSPDKPDPPRHMVVAHNNHFFAVELYGLNGQPLGTHQIADSLKKVVKMSKRSGNPIGILTSDNRNTWGKVYQKLTKDHTNRHSVDKIQRSIFLLCLDQPYGTAEGYDHVSTVAAGLDHGLGSSINSGNRWFDKTLQFIVSRDGAVGLNYEHAPAEGPPILSIVDHTLNFIKAGKKTPPVTDVKEPYHLEFNFNPIIDEAIDLASEALDATISDLDMTAFKFSTFGKNAIKAQKVSPDAFIQMAIQLAYHRTYGNNVATYESGSLRQFQHGRTETIRTCSVESRAFCLSMDTKDASNSKRDKRLREAIVAHRKYTDGVLQGQGIDRHLLGLKLAAIENGLDIPSFFMDPIYAQSVYWKLSTSQVPSSHNATLVFAPVVPDGYGLCYNPMPDCINMCVSAWNSSPETDSGKFAEAVRQALQDALEVLSSGSPQPAVQSRI